MTAVILPSGNVSLHLEQRAQWAMVAMRRPELFVPNECVIRGETGLSLDFLSNIRIKDDLD